MDSFGVHATTRASFYLYTLPEEIDRLVDGPREGARRPSQMSELDNLYREVILDHYKNPRGHGRDRGRRRRGRGTEPALRRRGLDLRLLRRGDTIEDVKFRGRGCAISQAATSMLMEMVKGRTAQEVAAMLDATSCSTRSASR